MPANHRVRSTHVVNGYIYREWLELQQAQDWVAQRHDPAAFLGAMADLAELVRMQDIMSGYALDAA